MRLISRPALLAQAKTVTLYWGLPQKMGSFCTKNDSSRRSLKGPTIVYSQIAPSDSPAVARHLIDSFFAHEPMGQALGLSIDEVEPWFPTFLEQMLSYYEPVSFMAKISETDQVIGASISIILDSENRLPPPSMMAFISKEKQPVKWQIATFLEDLEKGVHAVTALGMDPSASHKILACLFLSVMPNMGGKGIGTNLLKESEEKAKKIDGVDMAMVDVTSQFSYLAVLKLGYECIKEVEYACYEDPDGIPIFKDRENLLGVHTHARMMAKKF